MKSVRKETLRLHVPAPLLLPRVSTERCEINGFEIPRKARLLFDRLKKYKLRLNLAKCTFNAKSGKLLGLVVSERGIEVDLDKVKAIMQLPPPLTIRKLTEYEIKYVSRTSIKDQAVVDHLAEFLIKDNNPIDSDFLGEGILQVNQKEDKPAWKMYFDGAIDFTESGINAVLISLEGLNYLVTANIDFPCTNNVAEYEACITKDAKLVPYHEYLDELVENFERVSFIYMSRIKNQFADALATLASMVSITKEDLIKPLVIEITKGLAHCDSIDVADGKSWNEDIKHFRQTDQYPTFTYCHNQKTLRQIAAQYFSSRKTLYLCFLTPHYSGMSTKNRHNASWKKCTRRVVGPT
ncbi:hypothetical protein CRG98_013558 [Punica granatum]|uniref:RNase H type-1 domain-containing protein n=1 Tax=Punica granatum TaxID=22663 RepID=A0A2I0KD61_PUNGR|nr:hypothetical protein CRG98_013558 [Punica granatum]